MVKSVRFFLCVCVCVCVRESESEEQLFSVEACSAVPFSSINQLNCVFLCLVLFYFMVLSFARMSLIN